jgi:hypothetical protein
MNCSNTLQSIKYIQVSEALVHVMWPISSGSLEYQLSFSKCNAVCAWCMTCKWKSDEKLVCFKRDFRNPRHCPNIRDARGREPAGNEFDNYLVIITSSDIRRWMLDIRRILGKSASFLKYMSKRTRTQDLFSNLRMSGGLAHVTWPTSSGSIKYQLSNIPHETRFAPDVFEASLEASMWKYFENFLAANASSVIHDIFPA